MTFRVRPFTSILHAWHLITHWFLSLIICNKRIYGILMLIRFAKGLLCKRICLYVCDSFTHLLCSLSLFSLSVSLCLSLSPSHSLSLSLFFSLCFSHSFFLSLPLSILLISFFLSLSLPFQIKFFKNNN